MITSHRYDNGPVNSHGPCIADSGIGTYGLMNCNEPEERHLRTEYSIAGYACSEPDCGAQIELDASGQFAREHRKRRKRGGSWCDGGGRAKEFLREIGVA